MINSIRTKARQFRYNWKLRVQKIYKKDESKMDKVLEDLPSIDEVEEYLLRADLSHDYLTGATLPKGKYELDHQQPLSRSGSVSLDNIGPTSKRNNKIKGNFTLEEYKGLMELADTWESEGKKILERKLMQAATIFNRKKKK